MNDAMCMVYIIALGFCGSSELAKFGNYVDAVVEKLMIQWNPCKAVVENQMIIL